MRNAVQAVIITADEAIVDWGGFDAVRAGEGPHICRIRLVGDIKHLHVEPVELLAEEEEV